MSFLDFLKKKPEEPPKPEQDTQSLAAYSGMRTEVTSLDGNLLFVARLVNLRKDQAELHQYSETTLSQDPEQEPLRVQIRGYHDRERKAVSMEGAISPLPNRIWKVEELTLIKISNDRAFFRLDTNLDASVTSFEGLNRGEHPCKLLNISVGGARIRSEIHYQKGDKFLLKARLLEDREPSAIFCQVLRVIEREGALNEYGCQFLELNEADQDRITENIFTVQRMKRSRGM